MLVLSRKRGESIRIGDQIEVTVIHISPGRISLGIACPRNIPVHREEVYRRICTWQPLATQRFLCDSYSI